jgi:hypothetical protein
MCDAACSSTHAWAKGFRFASRRRSNDPALGVAQAEEVGVAAWNKVMNLDRFDLATGAA